MLLTKFHIIWPSGFRGKAVLEIDYSEAAGLNGPKCGGKHLWKVFYGNCSFRSDPLTNMAVIILVSDWSISKPLKPLGQMIRNLVGSIYGRFSINSAQFVPIR
jgi:hypothetical protein